METKTIYKGVKIKDLRAKCAKLQRLMEEKGAFKQGEFNPSAPMSDLLREIYAKPYLVLQEGQKIYGYPYRIYITGGAYGTGHTSPLELSDGFLGWTKGEAYGTLVQLIEELEKN